MYKPYPFRIKIHVDTMSPSMRRNLYKEIKAIHIWGRSRHFKEALQERDLSFSSTELFNMIGDSNLIEFHTNHGSRRVVVRHMNTGICMTLNLDSHDILTGWRNDVDDNHSSLNTDSYLFL